MHARRTTAALAAAALLGLAGCGDDGDGGSAATTDSTDTTATAAATSSASVDTSKKPNIKIPKGAPPPGFQIEDLKVGDGDTVNPGDTITAHYVGVSWSTGKEFDSSWKRGQPATFSLDQVVPGWQQGLPGMKVGGRRKLIIPPELGYGESGTAGIAPNETLVFVIDLKKIG